MKEKNVQGEIFINKEKKTVTIIFENGHYCMQHFTNGIKHFLDDEMEVQPNE